MTAQRWWVCLAARWLARVDGVSGQLRLGMLALTGISTATLTLRSYGHGEYAWPLIVAVGVGALIYTYAYTEYGVWNQMARDRQDMSTDFSGPTMAMDDVTIGVAAFVAMQGRKPTADERGMIEEAVKEQWQEYRNGLPEDWFDGD